MNTTVVLVRHGRSTANVAGVLAGRSQGVGLDETGTSQAAALVERFADVRIAAVISSPMQRCRETITPLAQAHGLPVLIDEGLVEVDYGSWTGRPLKDLGGEPLWKTVQQHPSAAVFPDGEGLAAMASRAVGSVRSQLAAHRSAPADSGDADGETPTAGHDDDPAGVIVLCSHGDVIKAILADALGCHLDQFQRISVAPASISVVRYTDHRTFVDRLGDTGTLQGLGAALPQQAVAGSTSDATPGGDTGTATGTPNGIATAGGSDAPPAPITDPVAPTASPVRD